MRSGEQNAYKERHTSSMKVFSKHKILKKRKGLECNYIIKKDLKSNKTSKAARHYVNATNVSKIFQSN